MRSASPRRAAFSRSSLRTFALSIQTWTIFHPATITNNASKSSVISIATHRAKQRSLELGQFPLRDNDEKISGDTLQKKRVDRILFPVLDLEENVIVAEMELRPDVRGYM